MRRTTIKLKLKEGNQEEKASNKDEETNHTEIDMQYIVCIPQSPKPALKPVLIPKHCSVHSQDPRGAKDHIVTALGLLGGSLELRQAMVEAEPPPPPPPPPTPRGQTKKVQEPDEVRLT